MAAAVFDGDHRDLNREAMVQLRAKQGGLRVDKLVPVAGRNALGPCV